MFRAANRSICWQHFCPLAAAKDFFFQRSLLLLHSAASDVPPPSFRKFGTLWNVKHGLSSSSTVPTLAKSGSLDYLSLQRRTFLGLGDGDEDPGLSKQHEETRVVGYTPEQLFAVVAAVDLYPDFVPWCQNSKILWQKGDALEAELQIGFNFLVERYRSHVELTKPSLIKTTVSESNVFEYLTNVWEFKPGPKPGTCNLHFSVKFQFRSPLYRKVANMFFQEVVSCLVGSFEERCHRVYGPSTKVLETTQAA